MAKHNTKRRRNNRSLRKRNKRTRYNKKMKTGGHLNEDLPHYHLYVELPNGQTREIPEMFERTGMGKDSKVISGKVGDIYNYVEDQGIRRPFTLYWNGKKLDNRETKIRQIIVEGSKIPLYNNNFGNPIVVHYNDELPPEFVESHDLDLTDLRAPQTPR